MEKGKAKWVISTSYKDSDGSMMLYPLKMIYKHICQFNRAQWQQQGLFHLISTVEI